jgi:hypothetical protein
MASLPKAAREVDKLALGAAERKGADEEEDGSWPRFSPRLLD